jgi:ketosteroid isomerase-like protein
VRFIALGGLILAVSLQMNAQAGQTDADRSQSVINLENAWNQAVGTHDENALKGLLAETFVVTDSDGRLMDREQWLKRVLSETKNNGGRPVGLTQTTHVYGDVVVVTGVILDKTRIKGESVDRRSRFTDTWIFRNSQWECVAGQITLAAH